jgi:hypothetical protein
MRKLGILSLLGLCLIICLAADDDSCGGDTRTEADKKQDSAQEMLASQGVQQVGMPGVTQFTEKRMVRMLYELRDKNIATFAYIPDLNGKLWHLCDAIGYGLPYGVQFTNPHKPLNPQYSQSSMADQPEPNGLFMPPTAEGTWVICADSNGKPAPVYVEPRVIVSPFKLKAEGEYAIAK